MPKISIIVPVYNAQNYIYRCVDSILDQTFSDFELILVDDGSSDNCGAICDAYAAKDSRIKVIHQENQGQAVARNNGVTAAQSEWICFVDSDDLIHPKMLEQLYSIVENGNVGISACNAVEAEDIPDDFFGEKEAPFSFVAVDEAGIYTIKEEWKYCYWIVCCKLIRRSILIDYPLPKGRVYEDNAIVPRWLYQAREVAYTSTPYYFYRVNEVGTTKSGFSLKKLDLLWALEEQMKFYHSVGYQQMKQEICAYYLKTAAWYSGRVRNELNDYRSAAKVRKQMRRIIDENPLDTLPLSKDECIMIEKAFHPLREQMRNLPNNIYAILRQGGIQLLRKRIFRKFKRY